MKKTYSLAELKQLAAPYFKEYNQEVLFATEDGQVFLMESRAKLHAGQNGKVHRLENEDMEEAKADKPEPMSVAKLKDKLAATSDIKEVEAMLMEEVNGPNRSSAVAAIEKRARELAGTNSPQIRGDEPATGGEAADTPEKDTNQ